LIVHNIISNNIYDLDADSLNVIRNSFSMVKFFYTNCIFDIRCTSNLFNLENPKIIHEKMKYYQDTYQLSNDHFEIPVFYYHNGLKYLPRNIIKQLEKKDFIDGGAYNGDSALIFEKHYNPKKIYSFNYNIILRIVINKNNNKERV
ncbi:unnamed protein product, partial [marine sediment metagenome]